ncbi:MAG: MarR family transcriptional regulator [Promethearchaeati archaeon SRVP18_Atabeyarchaeia-1]
MSEIDKIRELINKSEARITELENSIQKARDTFSSESRKVVEAAVRVSAEQGEFNKKMGVHDENIERLEERRQELKTEVNQLEQKTKETEKRYSSASSDIKNNQKEIDKMQSTLQQYQTKADALKAQLVELEKESNSVHGNLDTLNLSNEKEFETLENARSEFQRKTKELSEKEPITHFLLSETKSEPPEVTIVSKLIGENGQISIDDLKKTTKINSASVTKAIESLEQKGIVSRTDKDTIRLLKK